MWLANLRDFIQFLRNENTLESVADYPLFIEFTKERDFHNKMGWPHGYRYKDSGCCAFASLTDNDETLIELQIPIPAYCPYDLHNSVIMLINHEIMHIVLEDFLEGEEGLEASDMWDDSKIVKKMNRLLSEVYCACDSKINPAQAAI